jgi:protein-S-isoprenylcysteine O-methyltransferase Ste14
MDVTQFVDLLLDVAGKPRSTAYKTVAIIAALALFLAAAPGLLYLAAMALERYVLAPSAESLYIGAAYVCIAIGLLIIAWAVFTQLSIGRGTPVPVAPTQKLIVSGPYKLCRNPIQLGAIVYYFGLGMLLQSVSIALLMAALAFVLGGAYQKLVEERELERRFGTEYVEYRSKTPFVIPKWGR